MICKIISGVFNGKIVYTNLNFITIENNSCDEVKPGEADGSVDVYIHQERDSTGNHVVVPCACDSSCGILEARRIAHMKSSNKPIFDCLLIFKSKNIERIFYRFFTNIMCICFVGDFCGRPKWWFRTPKAIPTPYAACDRCCKPENPDKMNVIFYSEEDNFAEVCRIDLVKWHNYNNNQSDNLE